MDDVYGCNLDNDWEVDADDGSATGSSRWKELWSKFDSYHQLLIRRHELEVFCSLNAPLDWLVVGASTAAPQLATPSCDIDTPVATVMRSRIALLGQPL